MKIILYTIPYEIPNEAAKINMLFASGLKELGLMKGNIDEALAAGAHALFFPHGLGHMMGLDVHDMEDLGEENVVDLPLRLTAEDFAYYTQKMPAVFYRLGTGNKSRGITSPVHTTTFDIDEEALVLSTGLMAWFAVKSLME